MSRGSSPGYFYSSEEFQSRRIQSMETQQQDMLKEQRARGLKKMKTFSVIQLLLAIATIGSGVATLVVAAENIGFPVFNFGPLVTGIICFIGGVFAQLAARKGAYEVHRDNVTSSNTRCYVVGLFASCVTNASIASLSAVFAFISGAVCAGADIVFYSGRNCRHSHDSGNCYPLDVKQYCEPNKDANTALGFIDGVLCVLVLVMSIFGTLFFCCYGRSFGFQSRRVVIYNGGRS